jgi:trimeric autotransporter adhesin
MTSSQTQIFQSDASSPNTRLAMSTKMGASSVNMGWSINGDFTGGTLSHIGVNLQSFVLPVELTYFKGQAVTTGNQLLWQTATELNAHGFFIQRAKDGVKWENLTFASGKGNSATINNYSWLDEAPMMGLNYYRLKQVDNDGRINYSPVILISDNKTHGLSLYPNPSRDVLYYQYDDPSQITLVQLYDATGKRMQETRSITGQLSLQDLPSGLYLFVLQTQNGNIQQRIVKQ